MSPEQAKGRPADKRSDVWGFGCVLFEMLTGKRAFQGEDVNDTIAAVLRGQPDWDALPRGTSAPVRTLLARALEKERVKRLADISVAQFLLSESILGAPGDLKVSAAAQIKRRRVVGLVAASLLVGAAGAASAIWLALRPAPTSARPVTRFRIALPSGTALMNPNSYPDLAFSPDGMRLVYVGLNAAGHEQVYVQSTDQLDPTPIPGVDSGNHPFFSPDGKWIGLVSADSNRLVKVPSGGGAVVKICTITGAGSATWLPDDSIVFSQRDRGLWRVSAAGGTPVALTAPDGTKEIAHRSPEVLPGGRAIVFTIARTTNYDEAAIGFLRLDTGERGVLVQGGMDPHYLQSGHLVFSRAGVILAMPFDLATLRVSGTPVPVIEGVYTNSNLGFAQFVVSPTGTVAYVPLGEAMGNRSLVWVDRHGAVQSVPAAQQGYEFPRLSPDGSQLAVSITGGPNAARRDIWVYTFARGTLSRLTSEKNEAETPVWTPDGTRVTYAVDRTEGGQTTRELMSRRADHSGDEESLARSDHHLHLSAWAPRADALISVATDAKDIWILRTNDKAAIGPLFQTSFQIRAPSISPDGRWLAYASDDTARFEIYLQAFPGPGRRYQVSRDGGTEPTWNKNGHEIFFRNGDKMMAATLAAKGDGLELGTPTTLFEGRFVKVTNPSGDAWYDVSPDGQRFLMLKSDDTHNITIVQNWSDELKARVATK